MTASRDVRAIGIEVSDFVVRAVTVDATGSPLRSVELELPDRSDASLALALERVAGLAPGDRPVRTRVAWFPSGATWQRFDVDDRTEAEIESLRSTWFADHGINASALTDASGWLVAARWDDSGARRLQRIARSADLTDVDVEPSPVALTRVLPDGATFARRTVDEATAWAMLCDEVAPVAAASLPVTRRDSPSATFGTGAATTPDTVLDDGSMLAYISAVAREGGGPLRLDEEAMCVARGAAVGALDDTAVSLSASDFEIRRTDAEVERSPWTVERIDDAVTVDEPSRWRKLLDRLVGRSMR